MSSPDSPRRVDWAHLVFLCIIGAITVFYVSDAVSVSFSANNLLLVLPVGLLVLVLCVGLLGRCIYPARHVATTAEGGIKELGSSELRSSDRGQLLRIGSVATALGAYVFLLDVVGFDIATWGFALAVMATCGERRPIPLLIYPLLVAGAVIGAFRAILPFPMPTTIL